MSEVICHKAGVSVQRLTRTDVILSAFFSLHRPLSVTTTIPPPSSEETFNNIFDSHPQRDPWADGNSAERKPEDVIYTLHNTIETLESQSNAAQDEAMRWQVLQESPTNNDSIKHLDGAPQMKSLEELVSQFKPFHAPPPPQAFPDESRANDKKTASKQRKQLAIPGHKMKIYQTTLTVIETTQADGQKVYSPSHSPIITLQDSQSQQQSQRPHQPFLERMRKRQQFYLQAQHSTYYPPRQSQDVWIGYW